MNGTMLEAQKREEVAALEDAVLMALQSHKTETALTIIRVLRDNGHECKLVSMLEEAEEYAKAHPVIAGVSTEYLVITHFVYLYNQEL